MNIYVASSWRNEHQPAVVEALRSDGHEVYDFRNPRPGNHGFRWEDIDQHFFLWDQEDYRNALNHPIAEGGFSSDFEAMKRADAFVGVMPFGRSASMEMGWAAGQGKLTIFLLQDEVIPELMVKMFDHICCSIEEVKEAIKKWNTRKGSK